MAEKGWLTGLDKQSTREGRTADNVRRKNRGGAPRGGARRKSCAGASQARPGMVSRQSTAYPDEEQRDSTCVTTVPPKWPMTAWGTACGDYFRVTTRKLARPLNTSAFERPELCSNLPLKASVVSRSCSRLERHRSQPNRSNSSEVQNAFLEESGAPAAGSVADQTALPSTLLFQRAGQK